MNWKQRLFKPGWENRKEEIRAEAVSQSNDPRFFKVIDDIAANDESALVRRKAIGRLVSLEQLQELHQSDPEPDNKAFIFNRIRSLLLAPPDAAPTLASRISFLEHWNDPESLERLAANADDPGLRFAALRKIGRQGFLGDRAIADPDPEIRKYAVEQLSQGSTMERVAAALRTRDKVLYRQLNERLQQRKLDRGDEVTANRSVELLLQHLEDLVKGSGIGKRKSELKQIDASWEELKSHASAEIKSRFETARSILQSALDNPTSTSTPGERAGQALSAAVRKMERLTALREFEACKNALEKLEAEFQRLLEAAADLLDTGTLREQFNTAQERVHRHLSQLAATQEVDAQLRKVLDDITRSAEGGKIQRAQFNDLTRAWQAAWTAVRQPNSREQTMNKLATQSLATMNTRISAQEEQHKHKIDEALGLLARLEEQLENGALGEALADRAKLQKLLPRIKHDRQWAEQQGNARIQACQLKLRELRDWQHWSNNEARNGLISQVEQLLDAELHPDAIVASVKEAQQSWKALEASEQIPGDKRFASSPSAWRRFNAACNKAYDTAKPFLEKRQELQQHRQQEMELLCRRLNEAIEAPEKDWKSLQRGMQAARKTMRKLDEVPAHQRHKTARLLRETMDAVSSVLESHYGEVEQRKRQLIREAQQIQHIENAAEAMDKAKQLQREWQAAGTMWRSRDQKLWNEFRAPIDPLFAAAGEAREQEKQDQKARIQQFSHLCEQLEAINALEAEQLLDQGGRVAGLEAEWRELGAPPKGLVQRFDKGLRAYRKRIEQASQAALHNERQCWHDKLQYCQQLESRLRAGKPIVALLKKIAGNWPGGGDSVPDRALDERFSGLQALASGADDPGVVFARQDEDTARAAELCIQLEFLAGMETPKQFREARMAYQVSRLSQTLSDASSRLPVMDELRQIEEHWYSLGPLTTDAQDALQTRFTRAIAELIKQSS